MRLLLILIALILFCPLAQAQAASPDATTVVESAAYISPEKTKAGKVKINVAVVVENPFGDKFASYPTVQVTARGADGSVMVTSEVHTGGIPPKGRSAYVGTVFTEERPAKVEIRPLSAQYEPTSYQRTEFRPFELVNVKAGEGPEGGYHVSGEVKNPYQAVTGAFVSILFRDAAGKLLGGRTKWVQKIPAGAAAPFELDIDANDVPPNTKRIDKVAYSQINFQKNLREIFGH